VRRAGDWHAPLLAVLALALVPAARAQSYSGHLLDAVRIAARHDPGVAASRQQVRAGEGALLEARAPFDTQWSAEVSRQRSYLPVLGIDNAVPTQQLTYKAGASRKLASGMVLQPALSLDHVRDDALQANGPATGTAALTLVVPLLKGAGAEVNLAPVVAAGENLQAAGAGYRHSLALAVARTVAAYWDRVAAGRVLELAQLAESRARGLLANARRLADADEIPRADLLKYEARRTAQESARMAAEQQLLQATQGLAQAMNVPLGEVAAAGALDDFPPAQGAHLERLLQPAALQRLVDDTLARRQDVQAAQRRLRAARTLAEATRHDRGTQLDLALSVGYTGLAHAGSSAGAWNALGRPAPGPNVGVTLTYVLPAGDRARRGLLMQREAAEEQARVELDALRLRIEGEVRTQLAALRSAAAQLAQAQRQRDLQTTIYEHERLGYQAGLSTLLDLFTAESQLTASQSEWVQAQRDFAQALVLFRYHAALLPHSDAELARLDADTLTSLPAAAGAQAPDR
jgi:outer membrane protein TolC